MPRSAHPGETALLDALDRVGRWRAVSGFPTPLLSSVPAGLPDASNHALRVQFFASRKAQFAGRAFRADAAWDRAAGLSFRFKGDGSDGFIAVSLIDETFTQRYAALLSLKSTHWHTIRLRWEDFVPEIITADWFGAPGSRMKPSKVRAVWFGRWFYLRPWSASSFKVDALRLEPKLEAPPQAAPETKKSDLARVRAKLKARQPVTIVTLGDSITYGTHLKNRLKDAYPAVLEGLLRRRFGYDRITVVNKGIGGLETRQAIVLLPRDVAPLAPDLVTAHFGYNDFSSMQGKPKLFARRRAIARENWMQLAARIRRAAAGKAEVLLIATIPGAGKGRWHAMDFFGTEAQAAAAQLHCGFTAAPRAAFQQALKSGTLSELFVRLDNGQRDTAHPNVAGHQRFAEALLKVFP